VGCDPSLLPRPVVTSNSKSVSTILGSTSACYKSQAACTSGAPELSSTSGCPSNGTPGTLYDTCTCTTVSESCGASNKYTYVGNVVTTTTSLTGSNTIPTGAAAKNLADVWARCLYQTDVSSDSGQQNITTHTIDVFSAQPDPNQNALLMNMAKYGGGTYQTATGGRPAIKAAIDRVISEIMSVNSTFASASLPVNASNRSQNENQVYIGMFRPDAEAQPRWFGNLKRYQLINSANSIELGDLYGNVATNNSTGFIADCATSWWSSDSANYWQNIPDPFSATPCKTTTFDRYSDAPDGPTVEKVVSQRYCEKAINRPPPTQVQLGQ